MKFINIPKKKSDAYKSIQNILKKISNTFEYKVRVVYDDQDNYSRLKYVDNKKTGQREYYISISMADIGKIKKDVLFETMVKVSDLYHEYRHYIQKYENIDKEIDVSKKLSEYCPVFAEGKYYMLPEEFDAEIYGLLQAKDFFESNFPDFDFETNMIEYINIVDNYYGPISEKEKRPVFKSFDELLEHLERYKEESYNASSKFSYNKFPEKSLSVEVEYMKDGAMQQYLLAKELCREGLVDQSFVNKTKKLMDFYHSKNEKIEDIILDIPKENSASSIIQDDIDIEKEGIDYEDG